MIIAMNKQKQTQKKCVMWRELGPRGPNHDSSATHHTERCSNVACNLERNTENVVCGRTRTSTLVLYGLGEESLGWHGGRSRLATRWDIMPTLGTREVLWCTFRRHCDTYRRCASPPLLSYLDLAYEVMVRWWGGNLRERDASNW